MEKQALRRGPKFRQQHGGGEKWIRFDPVEVCAKRTRPKRIVEKCGIARLGIVETARTDYLERRNRQQIEQHRSEYTPFSDRHGSSRGTCLTNSVSNRPLS
jgi:hypothetical protein